MRGSNAKRLDIPTSTGTIARLAVAFAEEKGADVESLLKESGLSRERIDDPNIRLAVQSQIRFLEVVAKAIGDDLLGFHLSQRFDLRAIGLPYYVLASSDRLDQAFRHAARYCSVVNDGIRLTLRERRKLTIIFEYISVPRHSAHDALFRSVLATGAAP